MIHDLTAPNQIILIGPIGVGKTTIGTLLVQRLRCPFASLDAVERSYLLAAGYDPAYAETLKEKPEPFASYSYRRQFFDAAVIGFLEDYREGVLELGAGHPVVPDLEKQARIARALEPYPRVVLLLPVPDLWESCQWLRERIVIPAGVPDPNTQFLGTDTYYQLAKVVVFTAGKTPEETCEEVLTAAGLPPAGGVEA